MLASLYSHRSTKGLPLSFVPNKQIFSPYASAPTTIYHHRAVVTGRQALDTALTLKWLQDNHWMDLLGVHDARAPSVVSDSETLAFPEGLNKNMLDTLEEEAG